MSKILVVDDYSVTLRVLSVQLRKGGYEVFTANTGYEALKQLGQESVDLAIIDIAMPEMDGVALLETLRKQPQFQQMPIIMLTASVLDDDRERALASGANAFLTKPVSSWELLDAVGRHLSQLPVN